MVRVYNNTPKPNTPLSEPPVDFYLRCFVPRPKGAAKVKYEFEWHAESTLLMINSFGSDDNETDIWESHLRPSDLEKQNINFTEKVRSFMCSTIDMLYWHMKNLNDYEYN